MPYRKNYGRSGFGRYGRTYRSSSKKKDSVIYIGSLKHLNSDGTYKDSTALYMGKNEVRLVDKSAEGAATTRSFKLTSDDINKLVEIIAKQF